MTKAHLFFIVRYSILNGEVGSWNITRQDWATYREQLFAPERLRQRSRLFSCLTLPSLAAQRFDCDVSISLLVITAAELPREALAELNEAVGELPEWLNVEVRSIEADGSGLGSVVQTAVGDSLREWYGDDEVAYATIRLDDDDLIANCYVEKLTRFVRPEFGDMVVSFPRGFIGTVGNNKGGVENIRHYYAPKVALGMAHVGVWRKAKMESPRGNVFSVGNHAEIDAKIPVIVDGSFDAFIRTFHEDNDSGSDAAQQEWITELPKAGDVVRARFPEKVLGENAVIAEIEPRDTKINQKDCQQEIAKLRACRRRRNKLRRLLDARGGSSKKWKMFR